MVSTPDFRSWESRVWVPLEMEFSLWLYDTSLLRAFHQQFFRSQLIWLYTVCKGRTYLGSAGSRLNNSLFYFLFNSYNYAYIHSSHNIIIQFLAFRFGKISYKWSILYCDVLAGKNNLPFFFFFFFFCLFVSSSLLSSVFKWIYSHMYNTILTFCLLV